MDGSAKDQHVLPGYKFGKKLGAGTFAEVKLAVHTLTGAKVAIKMLHRPSVDLEKVRREINMMRLLCHPRVVRLFEVIDTPSHIYMVMEYMSSGDLFDHLAANILHEDAARHFFQQIISGVEYCHRHNVVHRDLKLENILLDSDHNLKICDFGFANTTRDGHFMKTSCGSLNYAAPELIEGKLYAGPEVDVWSCGVILYALLCRRLPFISDSRHPNLHTKIKNGVYTMPNRVSEGARDLISKILVVDPMQRITIPDIVRHPWFKKHLPLYTAIPSPGVYAKDKEHLNHQETSLQVPSGKHKWTAGFKLHVHSQAPPRQLLLRILWIFCSLNVKWKKVRPYNMKCLWLPPPTKETDSRKADAIKFEIQLYRTGQLYVIDLQRLTGPPFIFLQVCATFRALVVQSICNMDVHAE